MTNLMRRESTEAQTVEGRANQQDRWLLPKATVYNRNENVILEVEMAGVTREKVEVSVERDELTITGYREVENYEGVEILYQERPPYNYRRTFVLSEAIDGNRISAAFENGVLKLTLPKAESAKPKKIDIQ